MLRRTFLIGAGTTGAVAACGATPSQKDASNAAPSGAAEAKYPPLGTIHQVGDQMVHATDQGAGRPVIMIHGASGNVRDFTFDLTGPLSQKYRVIAMDRPGFGYSTRPDVPGAWRPAAQAAQLRAAAQAMGVEKPILVGHSWGASVALAWALDAPDEVSGVVAASGAMMPWGTLATVVNSLGVNNLIVGYYNRSMTRRAETGGIEDFINRAFRPQSPPPGYVEYIGGELAIRDKTVQANGADLANTQTALQELSARYGELRVPLEVMHGDRDWLLGFEQHALGVAGAAPNVRVTQLPGVGHMAHHARPDVLEEAIARIAET